jgi:hypothetical protein
VTVDQVAVRPVPECDPEVSGVELGSGIDVVREVADDLVAEEVQVMRSA